MNSRRILFLLSLFTVIFSLSLFTACDNDDDDDDDDDNDTGDDDDDNDTGPDDDDDDDTYVVPPVTNASPPWPQWGLEHWVWEDESTQDSATALVDDYLANDIPVDAIIIDSPWATGYNTFLFDESKFPDAQGMIDYFHSLGVRVFLWATPNVNVDSPTYAEGLANGYYINDGRTLEWWKGEGSFIDYNNPEGLRWWHDQMDYVLDMGIDGWKTDGSEFQLILWGDIETATGDITFKEYQHSYYRDFYEYSREQYGDDKIITARPVDSYGIGVDGPDFAPVDVNFFGWVGDQDPTWNGLKNALHNMFASSLFGYVFFGSDIGAYRDDEIRDKELFVRWAQMGALCPVMENGGAGEHRPWIYDDEVLSIYRDFTNLHYSLIPYLFSVGADFYPQGLSVMRPTDRDRHEYQLGYDLFVAAMVKSGDTRSVRFPVGIWIDWWTGEEYNGGSTDTVDVPLERFPLFVRKGAVLPLDLKENSVFTDFSGDLPPLTVMVYPEMEGINSFNVYEETGTGALITASSIFMEDEFSISLSATDRQYAFCLVGVNAPAKVESSPAGALMQATDMIALSQADTGWYYDVLEQKLWIKPGDASAGVTIDVE